MTAGQLAVHARTLFGHAFAGVYILPNNDAALFVQLVNAKRHRLTFVAFLWRRYHFTCLIVIQGRRCVFFDSLATCLSQSHTVRLTTRLMNLFEHYEEMETRVQKTRLGCGHYCLAFTCFLMSNPTCADLKTFSCESEAEAVRTCQLFLMCQPLKAAL